MSIEEYNILGIEQENLKRKDSEQIDKIVRDAYKDKLNEFNSQINEILAGSDEYSEKLKKMEKVIQNYIIVRAAFNRIKTKKDREINNNDGIKGLEYAIDEEIKKYKKSKFLEKRKKHLDKVEGKAGEREGIKFLSGSETEVVESTAYQILSLPRSLEITDLKVHTNVIVLLKQTLSNKPLDTIDESEKMMNKVYKLMWAYTKIGSVEARTRYNDELKFLEKFEDKISESKSLVPALGRIESKENPNPRTRDILEHEKMQSLKLTEVGDLFITEANYSEYALGEYSLEKAANGEPSKKSTVIYSNIDVNKIQKDPEYEQAVRKLLSSNNIRLAKRFMAGYIGELVYKDGNWVVVYDEKNMAICEKYKRTKRTKAKQLKDLQENKHTKDAPDDNDEPGGH